MAFKMKGSPMQRNFPGAFKDTNPHTNKPHTEDEHTSQLPQKKTRKDIFETGQGSSRKTQEGEFFDVTTRTEKKRPKPGGDIEGVNVLPVAEVIAPTRKEDRKQGREDWRKEGGGKDQFKAALEAWKAGDREDPRPRRKDFKT